MGDKSVIRTDGWINVFTKMGYKGLDKKTGSAPETNILNQSEVEDLYVGDAVVRKIVDLIPQEGLREWIRYTNLKPEEEEPVKQKLKKLDVRKKFEKAWKVGRLYGDAMILLSVSDGLDLSEPLDVTKIKSLNALTILHRYNLTPDITSLETNLEDPNFGMPKYYMLNNTLSIASVSATTKIHYSRFLHISGTLLPEMALKTNSYWNDSILSAMWDEIEGFSTAHNSLGHIMRDYKTGILQLENIDAQMEAENDAAVSARLMAFDLAKSCMKTVILSMNEKYSEVTTPLSGVKEVIEKIEQRLIAASGIPHTLLLGEGPKGGLGSEGDSENRDFYDKVSAQQNDNLRQPLEKIFMILENTTVDPIKKVEFEFVPLWRLDDVENAKLRKTIAETDKVYLDTAVLTPEEVAINRFGGDKFGLEIQLEDGVREKNVSPVVE